MHTFTALLLSLTTAVSAKDYILGDAQFCNQPTARDCVEAFVAAGCDFGVGMLKVGKDSCVEYEECSAEACGGARRALDEVSSMPTPPPPPPPTVAFVLSGTVESFDETAQTSFLDSMATFLNISVSRLSITNVTAASINVEVAIEEKAGEPAAATLATEVAETTPTDLSTALGVTVEAAPVAHIPPPPEPAPAPAPAPSDPAPAPAPADPPADPAPAPAPAGGADAPSPAPEAKDKKESVDAAPSLAPLSKVFISVALALALIAY